MLALVHAHTHLHQYEVVELPAKRLRYTNDRDVTLLGRKRYTAPPPATAVGRGVARLVRNEPTRAARDPNAETVSDVLLPRRRFTPPRRHP